MRAGVAHTALAGASREELLRAALQGLAKEGYADRIGVWTEPETSGMRHHDGAVAFRGLVWDRENPENPQEWMNLSFAPPLPEELLLGRKVVEENLEASPERPIIGQLLGLRRALWIPVASKDRLRGGESCAYETRTSRLPGVFSARKPRGIPRRPCLRTWRPAAPRKRKKAMDRAPRLPSSAHSRFRKRHPPLPAKLSFIGAAETRPGRARSRASRWRMYGGGHCKRGS
jgi:hypothetical protein